LLRVGAGDTPTGHDRTEAAMTPTLCLLLTLAQTPIDLMVGIETSRNMEQALGLLNPKPLQKEDRAGVVGMLGERVRMLQGLTADRDALRSALREAGTRFGVALGGTDVIGPWTVDLATGIEKACAELDRQGVSDHRRAILVVFGSDDPGLRTRQASLRSVLKSTNARLYVAVIDRNASQPVTPPGVIVRPRPLFPVLTAQLLEELATASGGRIYRRGWDLREVLQDIRQ